MERVALQNDTAGGIHRFEALARLICHRPARIAAMMAAVVVMSMIDLHHTLVFVKSVGMGEANPLARWIMQTQPTGVLVAWKMASVGAVCAIFYLARHRRTGEVGAMVCMGVLIWLMMRWAMYTEHIGQFASVLPMPGDSIGHDWVHLP